MCFYFYSSLLHLKPSFLPPPPPPKGEISSCPTGIRGPSLVDIASSWLCPASFLWQVLEHNCRLKFMPLGQVRQALTGDTKKCFYKKTSRPRFYAEPYQFIIERTLGENRRNACPYMWGKKKAVFFTEATACCLKAKQECIMKSGAQEIQESSTFLLKHKF